MTDERPQDERVTAAYRDLAAERSPAHLDDKILRMAASQAQHRRYARSVTWTRPLAWAATIVLCLAITLELTRVPAPEEIAGIPAPTKEPLADVMPAAAETDLPAVKSPPPTSASLPEKLEAANEHSAVFSEEIESVGRAQGSRADHAAAPPAALKSRANDTDMLRQAAGIVMLAPCPDEVREDPEIWLQCIVALEENGDSELAAREREALIEVFPDFNLP